MALVPSAYLPSLGGVEELTRALALAHRAAGAEVEVWCQRDDAGTAAEREVLDGVTVRRFAFPLPRARLTSVLATTAVGGRALAGLRRAVRDFRPDVVHVQCFGPNGAYATAVSALAATPLVVTLQGETVMDDADIYEISSTMRAALRLGLRRAAAVTACSAFTLDDARRRFGLGAGKGEVIFNGVSVSAAAPSGAEPPVPGRYVLALGRVVEKKGFDLLIRAFAPLGAAHPDVKLVIGGSGNQEAALRRLVGELGVAERVHFAGRLSREQVAAAMAGADVFVMPSRLEPFGIVILEGWRAGAPVLASSVGGPPEFVRDGEDGVLADPRDTPALSAALDRLLADGELRRAIGAAGRARVAEFDWEPVAARYRDLYARVARTG